MVRLLSSPAIRATDLNESLDDDMIQTNKSVTYCIHYGTTTMLLLLLTQNPKALPQCRVCVCVRCCCVCVRVNLYLSV